MDVTAMLNSASAARREAQGSQGSGDPTPTGSVVESATIGAAAVHTPPPDAIPSRRTSESRTPNRSRTPWDAGGYSLPLTLDTKVTIQGPGRPGLYTDSPIDSASPNSPRHKFSDSYSSLSSYSSSSMTSFTHSRFSSLSTVSGFQGVGPLLTDMPALESRSCDNLDSAVSRSSMGDFSSRKSKRDGGLSPAAIVEESAFDGGRRPGSPSDAMLMSRGSQGSDRMSPQELSNPELKPASSFLALPDLSKSHKRAVSAPDFAVITAIDQTYPPIPQTLQPTPPPSHQGDRISAYSMEPQSASPAVPGQAPATDETPKCMYVDNCDTGSQPRKAISHIFGRNKLCTRMIPQNVWVHFCRKHYQRSRYRNAQEYSKLQCELVQKQIHRVSAWSEANKRAGQAGVVQDWSLSVRKREQKRIDDRMSSKKRPFRDESEDDEGDRAVLNGTAVPQWLLGKCGSGYSTAQIEEVVAQLKKEMDEGKLSQIPDIEILPNISTDSLDDGKSKVTFKRKTVGGAHKRSQSVGYTNNHRHDATSMIRRISQPGYSAGWRSDEVLHGSPIEKRQRTTDFSPYAMNDRRSHLNLPQVPERPVQPMRRITHLAHRPAFGHIRENQTEEVYFDDGSVRGPHYSFSRPLPAPTPQRLGEPMGSQLEASASPQSYFDPRRAMHSRSHSEMGTFQHNPGFNFRSPASLAYSATYQGYPSDAMSYEGYPRAEPAFGGPPGYYDEVPMNRGYAPQQLWSSPTDSSSYTIPRHTRHQSTSAITQAIPRIPPSDSPSPFDIQPHQHRRQYSCAPSETESMQRLHETSPAKAFYAERR